MEYKEFVKSLEKNDKYFQDTVNYIKNLKGKKVYVFSHDDPDGITSAVLMSRLLEELEIEFDIFFPPQFLFTRQDIPDSDFDSLIVMDKGSLPQYSEFGEFGKEALFIDHHFTTELPDKVLVYNPNADSTKYCSTSFLVHNILTAFGLESTYYDFFALVGLKGDFAIEPATGFVSDYVKSFYDSVQKKFMKLLHPMQIRPTMFDVEQREKSCYLSQFSELIHAVSGGGFQFFYNDHDPKLEKVDQPMLSYNYLRELEDLNFHFNDVTSLFDFVTPSAYKEHLSLIFELFMKDWDNGINILKNAVLLDTIRETGFFLYCGNKVPLMPMLGSVTVFDLKQEAGIKDGLIVMASKDKDFVHFSVRATGGKFHSGKICGHMAEIWKENRKKGAKPNLISGGGHPRAAECTSKQGSIAFPAALYEFLGIFKSIQQGSQEFFIEEG